MCGIAAGHEGINAHTFTCNDTVKTQPPSIFVACTGQGASAFIRSPVVTTNDGEITSGKEEESHNFIIRRFFLVI